MTTILAINHSLPVTKPDEFDFENNDRWPFKVLGLQPDYGHACYYILFERLKVAWFKSSVKKFIRLQATTKSFSSCRSYITGLAWFDLFLRSESYVPTPQDINRTTIVRFLGFLAQQDCGLVSRKIAIIHLRTFHQYVIREEWLSWPEHPLIYNDDIPRGEDHVPKFIPEFVIAQLKRHLVHLPALFQRLIIILLEVGRRITEITSLPYACLDQDKDGDWLLKIFESKMNRSYLLPISKACYEAIRAQQDDVLKNPKYINQDFLFPSRRNGALTKTMNVRRINRELNKLSQSFAIQDINGQPWHFHVHQFRHTVGTRMINAGVSQIMVQKYLGHESAEMTLRYAHIHDQTLKEVFKKFEGTLIDIHGMQQNIGAEHEDALWLKKNIMAQALPNGLCTLPLQQKRCPHANACLNCGHFRTTKKHLPQHKAQLEQTVQFIEKAKSSGLTHQVEVNENLKTNLETIINRLEKLE